MGITGLLPLLRPIQRNTHISEFAGKTLAVDGYVWLHRGAYACAVELVTGKPTNKYVDYFISRVRLLRHHRITPYIVFDGGHLPAKQGTESERKKKREDNLRQATALANAGKQSDAREYYAKCVDVTPQMAYQVIKALKAEQAPYIVAPYEADAQMRYLEQEGIVDGIITEDSDLLVFGARCVLFKFDTSGHVVAIRREDFGLLHTNTASFIGWTDDHFREMAILSGCDYLDSIQGIGIVTAAKMMRKYKNVEKILQFLRLEGNKRIPKDYIAAFRMAELAFKHQRVFDPRSERLVYLTEPVEGVLDDKQEAYVGRDLDAELAKAIAFGDRDPSTHEPMKDINPSYNPEASRSTLRLPLSDISRTNVARGGKPKSEVKVGGIMKWFAPIAKTIGKASGKTSLTEVMQLDIDKRLQAQAQARTQTCSPITSPCSTPKKTSRFFSTSAVASPMKKASKRSRDAHEDVEGPRRAKQLRDENYFEDEEDDKENTAMVVEQEDGYMSPKSVGSSGSWSEGTGMTSPIDRSPVRHKSPFDVDPVSSPVHATAFPKSKQAFFLHGQATFSAPSLARRNVVTLLPANASVETLERCTRDAEKLEENDGDTIPGPDLADMFQDESDDEDRDMILRHVIAEGIEEEEVEREEVILVESSSPLRPQAPVPALGGDSQESANTGPSPAPTEIADSMDELDDEDLFGEKQRQISEGWRKVYAMKTTLKSSFSSPAPVAGTVAPKPQKAVFGALPLPRRYSAPAKGSGGASKTKAKPAATAKGVKKAGSGSGSRPKEPLTMSSLAAFRFRG